MPQHRRHSFRLGTALCICTLTLASCQSPSATASLENSASAAEKWETYWDLYNPTQHDPYEALEEINRRSGFIHEKRLEISTKEGKYHQISLPDYWIDRAAYIDTTQDPHRNVSADELFKELDRQAFNALVHQSFNWTFDGPESLHVYLKDLDQPRTKTLALAKNVRHVDPKWSSTLNADFNIFVQMLKNTQALKESLGPALTSTDPAKGIRDALSSREGSADGFSFPWAGPYPPIADGRIASEFNADHPRIAIERLERASVEKKDLHIAPAVEPEHIAPTDDHHYNVYEIQFVLSYRLPINKNAGEKIQLSSTFTAEWFGYILEDANKKFFPLFTYSLVPLRGIEATKTFDAYGSNNVLALASPFSESTFDGVEP